MARLRAPGGCPWDREQTFDSIKRYTLEETYEVLEAIDNRDWPELTSELGDLLLQVLFYAEMAQEEERFSIDDVLDALSQKLISRHPHVFGDVKAEDANQVLKNWEAIKAEEKRAKAKDKSQATSILDGVSTKAPSLMEAHQISTKVARVGFDWKNVEDIFAKMHEELDELREAIKAHAETNDEEDHAKVREEIGDLLFVITNIARRLNVEPEAALKLSNRKFRRRFNFIEQNLRERNRGFDDVSLTDLEALWQEAKRSE